MKLQNIKYFITISLAVNILLSACAGATPMPTANATVTPVMQRGVWDELLQAMPIAHAFPLPEPQPTAIDGTYAKVDLSVPQFWTCYRCADYRPSGGVWRIQFDKGVMRIFYQITNWKSIASYSVKGNRVKIFNDPFCPQAVGEYEWQLKNGALTLIAIQDDCAFDLRKQNLIKQTWSGCESDIPVEGCVDAPPTLTGEVASASPVTVTLHAGDSHMFTNRPDVFAAANPENVPSPTGIHITYADESIPYGTHRVLWWQGDWMEATTDLPFTSIGVQLWGSGYLGWARVLFDGEEVWRGLSTALGKSYAYYGGYIEITGFEAGTHTIRVENLGFEYRPIKVYSFGFSNHEVGK